MKTCVDLGTYHDLLCYELIQPGRVNVVLEETFSLDESHQILHCGPEVTTDTKLLQGNHHIPKDGMHRIKLFLQMGCMRLSYSYGWLVIHMDG